MSNRSPEALEGDTASIRAAQEVDVSSEDVELARITRGLYVGVTGNVEVIFVGNNTSVVLVGLAAGIWHPMQIQQINTAGTTATGIVAGY